MKSLWHIITDIVVVLVVVILIVFVYRTYGNDMLVYLFGEQREGIALDDVSLIVSYADDESERVQGLSGVASLGETEGMLFFFDQEDYYGIWMKEMLIPIDIIWINDNLEVVHIEENVTPETFPATYYPLEPARFVLEVNAFFVDTYRIELGDKLSLPAADLPADLKRRLQ